MNLLKSICYASVITLANFNPINPVFAHETRINTLTVTGQGVESIPSTLMEVNLAVEVRRNDAVSVQQEINDRSNRLIDFLRKRQVDKLQTTGFQLQPQYQYKDGQQIFQGYRGINSIRFQLPVDEIGNLLDESLRMGATRIDNIRFTATVEAIANAEKEALKKATEDAQQQANTVLGKLNLSPKSITNIQINGQSVAPPRMMERAQAMNESVVVGGEQNIRASVTLQISY